MHSAVTPSTDSPAPGTYDAKPSLDPSTGPRFGTPNAKDRSPMCVVTQVRGRALRLLMWVLGPCALLRCAPQLVPTTC